MPRLSQIAALIAVAATAGCSSYSARRAALVPHARPSFQTGQPHQRAFEATVAGNVAALAPPSETVGAGGLQIPRTQLTSDLRWAPHEQASVGLLFEHGLDSGAHAVSNGATDPDAGNVWGAGATAQFSLPLGHPAWHLGLGGELSFYSVPWVEQVDCTGDCPASSAADVDRGRSVIPVVAFQLTPSVRLGRFTLFSSATLRTHPQNQSASADLGAEPPEQEGVTPGGMNVLAAVGVEADVVYGVRVGALAYQNITTSPVRYGPTFAATLTIPLSGLL